MEIKIVDKKNALFNALKNISAKSFVELKNTKDGLYVNILDKTDQEAGNPNFMTMREFPSIHSQTFNIYLSFPKHVHVGLEMIDQPEIHLMVDETDNNAVSFFKIKNKKSWLKFVCNKVTTNWGDKVRGALSTSIKHHVLHSNKKELDVFSKYYHITATTAAQEEFILYADYQTGKFEGRNDAFCYTFDNKSIVNEKTTEDYFLSIPFKVFDSFKPSTSNVLNVHESNGGLIFISIEHDNEKTIILPNV